MRSEMKAPEDRGKPKQIFQIEPVLGEDAVDSEQARDDREQQHHGEVGGDEEKDAFHGPVSVSAD